MKGTDISISNFATKVEHAQICVSTHGQINVEISGRKKMDLKQLKCMVVDEADAFFYDDRTFEALNSVCKYPDIANRDAANRV